MRKYKAHSFTIIKGKTYRAAINLSFLESFATNDYIANMFGDMGFVDVTVTGSGETRFGQGKWLGESRVVGLDNHIITVSVVENASNT